MARHKPELTDAQWAKIQPLLPSEEASPKGGRKRIARRRCFEGILWVLRSGARWKDLPPSYPSPSTCWRRLNEWQEEGVWEQAWIALIHELDEDGQLNWMNVFADGTFSPAKKGAIVWEKPNVERVQSLWWWRMARVYLSEFRSNPHRPTRRR
jgi:transposase